jgi:hypothetical protein
LRLNFLSSLPRYFFRYLKSFFSARSTRIFEEKSGFKQHCSVSLLEQNRHALAKFLLDLFGDENLSVRRYGNELLGAGRRMEEVLAERLERALQIDIFAVLVNPKN